MVVADHNDRDRRPSVLCLLLLLLGHWRHAFRQRNAFGSLLFLSSLLSVSHLPPYWLKPPMDCSYASLFCFSFLQVAFLASPFFFYLISCGNVLLLEWPETKSKSMEKDMWIKSHFDLHYIRERVIRGGNSLNNGSWDGRAYPPPCPPSCPPLQTQLRHLLQVF